MGVSVGGRIWEELRKGAMPEVVAREQEGILSGMDAAFTALDRLQKAALSFEVGPAPKPHKRSLLCPSTLAAWIQPYMQSRSCAASLAPWSTMNRFEGSQSGKAC